MITKYIFLSPEGDIPVGPIDLAKPFKITPSEKHPFLTLGDYFKAIKKFILKDKVGYLTALLSDRLDKSISFDRINKLLIRSEKHGALYHLASVEMFVDGQPIKYAVSTAVSDRGKTYLNCEYDALNYLEESFNLPYLPKVYFRGEGWLYAGDRKESLAMFLAEWLENYHEWHLSMDEKEKDQKVCIWDQKTGHRFASQKETLEIFRQASKILTLYYDTGDFRQIYPWHHAAGDFVVKTWKGKIDVKLTTARNYEPVMTFLKEEDTNPLVAIIYFFLNLTIKMRLDKIDGLRDVAWAEDFVLPAVMEGFFEGLKTKEQEGSYRLGRIQDLHSLLKSFSWKEIYKLFQPLLEFYREDDPDDFSVIKMNLEGHVRQLHLVIQRLRV